MSNQNIKKVAISIGDPNGIGSEVVLKTLNRKDITDICTPIIFAPTRLWKFYQEHFKIKNTPFVCKSIKDVRNKRVNLIFDKELEPKIEWGKATQQGGELAYQSLSQAANAVKNGDADLLVTAPINKQNIQSDEFQFPGHTEYLENLWGGKALMFMVEEQIKVGLVTQHIPLKEVATQLNPQAITEKLDLIHDSCVKDFSITKPRIAVLGLNPHAGDNGLLGKEEQEIIIPTLKNYLEKKQRLVYGPFSADSFFTPYSLNKFDAILAMYHDQGLIPFKTLTFKNGVNFTAGLPFVRTSPDHGVGYDLAGKGEADESSFVEALYTALSVHKNRTEYETLKSNALKTPQKEKSINR